MFYNVADIVDKTIKIEEKRIVMINDLIDENRNLPTINLLGKVFRKESFKMISYYKDIKREISNCEVEEIDFRTYDKISFLITEFYNSMFIPHTKTPKEYLKHALNIAVDELALFIDIQGRIVNNSRNTYKITYEILSKIILRLEKQVENIDKLLKN